MEMTIYDTLVILSPYVVPLLIAIGGSIGWMLGRRGKAEMATAVVEKIQAETELMASDEWKRLYDTTYEKLRIVESDIEDLKNAAKISTLEIERLKNMLKIANNGITYLLDGIAILTGQMTNLGIKPEFVPKVSVLVGDDDDTGEQREQNVTQ